MHWEHNKVTLIFGTFFCQRDTQYGTEEIYIRVIFARLHHMFLLPPCCEHLALDIHIRTIVCLNIFVVYHGITRGFVVLCGDYLIAYQAYSWIYFFNH